MKLFIYGTLKKGKQRNFYLKGEKFLGNVKTAPKYYLFRNYLEGFPSLIESGRKGRSIQGELWDVSQESLIKLDFIENPRLFVRRNVELEDGMKVGCYFTKHKNWLHKDLGEKY